MPTADYSSYHQAQGTTSDGTKFDNFIDAVQATVNGLDHNNLSASAGVVPAQLADPGAGKVLGSVGAACAAVFPPGYEYSYVEFTTNKTVTAVTEGTADTVVTAGSVSYAGTEAVIIEFFSTLVLNSGANETQFALYDNGVSIGWIGDQIQTAASQGASMRVARRLVPSAGAHVYSIRSWVAAGTTTVYAGNGSGGGVRFPGFIRVTRAA